jgi:hypothetical protein
MRMRLTASSTVTVIVRRRAVRLESAAVAIVSGPSC